jgi:hypothetical protein
MQAYTASRRPISKYIGISLALGALAFSMSACWEKGALGFLGFLFFLGAVLLFFVPHRLPRRCYYPITHLDLRNLPLILGFMAVAVALKPHNYAGNIPMGIVTLFALLMLIADVARSVFEPVIITKAP